MIPFEPPAIQDASSASRIVAFAMSPMQCHGGRCSYPHGRCRIAITINFMLRTVRRLLRCMNRVLGVAEECLIATQLLLRTVRLCLRPLLSLRKEYLVLNSGGDYLPGLFSELASVLGMLDHYERWRDQYAGARIDFKDQGLYFDPAVGNNWWEYYFEPVRLGTEANSVTRAISVGQHVRFAYWAETEMTRERGFALLNRYVSVKPHIRQKVDVFARARFEDSFMIGIHYRGTDKEEEAPRVPYVDVCAAVRTAIVGNGTDRYGLFLATDEQAFVEHMLNAFPNRVHCWETLRSVDGTPNWVNGKHNYRKGEDAVIDCLLLSRCHLLIRTQSNLGLCSALFNPGVPQLVLNRAYA